MSPQPDSRMSTACAVFRLLLWIVVPSPGDVLRWVRSLFEATPLGTRLLNHRSRRVPLTARVSPRHRVSANPPLRTAVPSPGCALPPSALMPVKSRVQSCFGVRHSSPDSTPPRPKSFLEKTLTCANAPRSAPPASRPEPQASSQPSHDLTAQPPAAAHALAQAAALGCGEDVAGGHGGDRVGQVEGGDLPAKQLCMVIDAAGVRGMRDVGVPQGYVVRGYRDGDEVTLAGTLRAAGFVDWDVGRVLGYLENSDRRAGSAVVECEGSIVASTFASRMSSGATSPVTGKAGDPTREGLLDYVATRPDHQGRGLGRATCTAVSRYLVDQGCETVSLWTDDWRLPAIHLYLSLGYRPVMNRGDMPGRWAKVIAELEKHGHAHA